MIYRQKDYKTLVQNIESITKKVDKQKDTQIYAAGAQKNKTQDRKLQRDESLLKEYQ